MTYEVKSLNEECGVFGIWGHPQAAQVTYFGLHSLQHRGQEGAGIVSNDNGKLYGYRNVGLLSEVFKNQSSKLKVYRVDELQKVNGVWLVKNNTLTPTGFDWNDNGIPASEIDEVDANGNLTADQVLQKGGYFIFNPKTLKTVEKPIQGTAGLTWAKTRFANGSSVWLRVDNSQELLYK